ncbi:MAG: DNA polymerase I [Candidatus Marinimicrobia bacterium]|nr:DNA polymerase I [Candidatus Neomarinimicrobiota bacterium]|tara:strand:- start:1832 stop:4603 length:2772 start_codon:yes stop_codon:yes gene_type:complete
MSKIKKTDHFYLVDGSGYIFRAYYALPPLSRKSDGLPTGAVIGFCNMLFKLLEDSKSDDSKNKPTHFAVIFDSARKNFRNEIYKDYKANRSEAPEDLVPQFEYIRRAVKAFNLPSIEQINYEADDLLATYARQIIDLGAKVTIISSDKDLMQLVSKNIRLFDPMKSKVIGEKEVEEKFGVKPKQVIDVQSLAGDSSDNIPGVPGIGIKTAAELIKKYKNLDTLLKKTGEISQKKRRETLIDNRDSALLSRKLVTLKEDVPVKENIESFLIKDIEKDKLYNFLREMEFNRLLSQAISFYGESSSKKVISGEEKPRQKTINLKKYETITEEKQLDKWVSDLKNRSLISVDTETTSLYPVEADLVGISFCYAPNYACYIPLEHSGKKCLDKNLVLKKIKTILEDKSIKKIGQNVKFDNIILKKYNINTEPLEDTMLASYTLDAGLNRHNLDTLSELHLGHKTITFKDLVGTGKNKISFSDVDLKKATEYAAEDADVTFRLYEILKDRLDKEKLNKIYELFEKPLIKILSNMEINGIKVNKDYLGKLSKKFENKIKKIEKEIYSLAKKEFNIASTKQLGEIIYNELKIANLKKTKKGSLATSATILEDLAFKGHKFPSLVLSWRQLSKLKNTYTDALQDHINPNTNRVHSSFLLAATNTGRLASSDPNLQNIPIKTEDGREIRKAFIPEKDNILISADYNQIEMRILADMADVKELKSAFINKEDIHSLTASQVFNVPLKKVDENLRRKAKTINFGIIYGITQYGLAKQISVSNEEALEFINSYFKKFPEIKDYMNSTIKFCRKNGYVNNIFGRRIHLRGINDKNFNVRSFQERAAINAPIQSSAADIIRIAMINIKELVDSKKIYDTKMLLQIHDELVFECSKVKQAAVEEIVKKTMESISSSQYHMFSIPLDVNVNSGNNWDEAH